MSINGEALKQLRAICNTRNLRVEVEHVARITVVTISQRVGEWRCVRTDTDAARAYKSAHAAVLERWPRLGGRGGANHTAATIAAKRARLEAEQRQALHASFPGEWPCP